MEALQLRPAKLEDTAFLLDLARQAYREVVTLQFGSWDDAEQGARFAAKLARVAFELGEFERVPVAAVSSSVHSDHVFLNELLVLPAFQNRGFGAFLLNRELTRAADLGLPLRLHTLRLNRAIGLYQRHGFVVTGRSEIFVDLEHAGSRDVAHAD